MLAQSLASTNARLEKVRAYKAAHDLEGIEETQELVCCEVTGTVIDNEVDQQLCDQISQQLTYE